MSAFPKPAPENYYLAQHVAFLLTSLKHWTGRDLVPDRRPIEEQARQVFHAPFALVSHDTAADPVFNYANRTALDLFEMTWEEFTALPSRLSAEPPSQEERTQLLTTVRAHGFIDGYEGVRISKTGRRFRIEDVTVWNLFDDERRYYGQAAVYSRWMFL
jgi:hypothetical protein